MNEDCKLKRIANLVVSYQMISIVCFLSISIIFEMNKILLGLFIVIFFIYSFYIMAILIFRDNLCPNCSNTFFKKKDTLINIGFSIYTKKCTNCGYRLK